MTPPLAPPTVTAAQSALRPWSSGVVFSINLGMLRKPEAPRHYSKGLSALWVVTGDADGLDVRSSYAARRALSTLPPCDAGGSGMGGMASIA